MTCSWCSWASLGLGISHSGQCTARWFRRHSKIWYRGRGRWHTSGRRSRIEERTGWRSMTCSWCSWASLGLGISHSGRCIARWFRRHSKIWYRGRGSWHTSGRRSRIGERTGWR
ncbi:hypothetical protein K493DRAFT_66152 [Basidiobolus meristosporus CBS 931.73]|uniref:Uncharacterized protein n=1 Tax=Basidiobolus meristosporus CBS 931.73 TaxID=1314790 RepID=A0A1Y1XVC2_9FUNG|nr:hypothetical protein K493DRAFT_66152 [Basidiobolus meristosporus CBS 931.73]|eukprot:ORX89699.1 hypothetical protein K493DRAFT_66152 [Basidiobolus meristosporus CBS 931.73]